MRTYHFARALSQIGDLTIGLFSPAEEFSRSAIDFPARIIGPASRRGNRKGGRLGGWLDAASVAVMPWRDKWGGLLRYIVAMTNESHNAAQPGRSMLFRLFRWEFKMATRHFNPMPLMTYWHRDGFEAIRETLELEVRNRGFDIVWFEHGFNVPLLEELLAAAGQATIVVCNTHNMESDLARQFEVNSDSTSTMSQWQLQPALLKRVESRAFAISDLVVACSDSDREIALSHVPSATVVVAENGVDTEYFRPSNESLKAEVPTILFTGLFTYAPNIDAARYLINEILPLIRASVPGCQIVFAGRNAGPSLESLVGNLGGVRLVTDPIDMRPEFEHAWVFVAPLRMGGGTRLKIVEAMAMECPVVSTPIGAEGMPYAAGRHLLVADDPSAFAAAVVRLIRDPQLRVKIGHEAAALVRANYDWSEVTTKAVNKVDLLAKEKSGV
jgi:glycosyltransferase involved in cell wall biosynthesis